MRYIDFEIMMGSNLIFSLSLVESSLNDVLMTQIDLTVTHNRNKIS